MTSAFSPKRLWLTLTCIGVYGGLLVPLVVFPGVYHPFVTPKAVFLQVLVALTFPSYLLLAWREPAFRPTKAFLSMAMGAQFAAWGISTLFSASPQRSFWGNQSRMNGLFTLFHFFLWALMASSVLKSREQWIKILGVQVWGGLLMLAIAFWQWFSPSAGTFGLASEVPRVFGLAGNSIFFSHCIVFVGFWAALVWIRFPGNSLPRPTLRLVSILLLVWLGLIASASRGPIGGMLAGMITFFAVYWFLKKNINKKLILGLCITTIAGILLYWGVNRWLLHIPSLQIFWKDHHNLERLFTFYVSDKFNLSKIAWASFLEKPFVGWGIGNYDYAFAKSYIPNLCLWFYEDQPHNHFFEVLSTTGILGTAAEIIIWIALFRAVFVAYKNKRLGRAPTALLFGLLVAHLIQLQSAFYTLPSWSMFYFLCALLLGINNPIFAQSRPAKPIILSTQPKHWLAFGILQIAAVLIIFRYSIIPFYGSYFLTKGISFFNKGKLHSMKTHFEKSFHWHYLYQEEWLNIVLQVMNKIAESEAAKTWHEWESMLYSVEKKAALVLLDPAARAHLGPTFARLLDKAWQTEKNPTILERAGKEHQANLELSPKRQNCQVNYAYWLAQAGKLEEAQLQYEKAIALDPGNGFAWWHSGVFHWIHRKDAAEGSRRLNTALFEVRCPHVTASPRELIQRVQLLAFLDKTDELKNTLQLVLFHPFLQASHLIEIAQVYERVGMKNEEAQVLEQVISKVPQWKTSLESVITEKTASIADWKRGHEVINNEQ